MGVVKSNGGCSVRRKRVLGTLGLFCLGARETEVVCLVPFARPRRVKSTKRPIFCHARYEEARADIRLMARGL